MINFIANLTGAPVPQVRKELEDFIAGIVAGLWMLVILYCLGRWVGALV